MDQAIDNISAMDFLRNPKLVDTAALFTAACSAYADRLAYCIDGRWINHAECAARIGAISASLHDVLSAYRHETGKQPVVAVLLPNSYVALECFFTAAVTGSIVLPINHRLTAAEVSDALLTSGAAILVTSNEFAPVIGAIDWQKLSINTVVWTTEPVALPVIDHRAWNDLISAPQPTPAEQFNPPPSGPRPLCR